MISISTLLNLSHLFLVTTLMASPYAVQSIGNTPSDTAHGNFSYDSAGNRMSNGQGQDITMGLVTKPTKITHAHLGDEIIKYGPRGKRYLRVNAVGERIIYVGDMEYRLSASDESIVYIRNGHYYPIAQVKTTAATPEYVYWLRDHLGSGVSKVDDAGTSVAQTRYDAWGTPTAPTGVAVAQDKRFRGFTGHENIPSAQMVDMNARLYALDSSAFLGPDRVINNPGGLPWLNRYCYGGNNPLSGTDPSGNVFEEANITQDVLEDGHLINFTVPHNRNGDNNYAFRFDTEDPFTFDQIGVGREFRFTDLVNIGPGGASIAGEVNRNRMGYLAILLERFHLPTQSPVTGMEASNVRTEFIADLLSHARDQLEGMTLESSFTLHINLTQSDYFMADREHYLAIEGLMNVTFPSEFLRNQAIDPTLSNSRFAREALTARRQEYSLVSTRARRLADGDLLASLDFRRRGRHSPSDSTLSSSRPASEITIPQSELTQRPSIPRVRVME